MEPKNVIKPIKVRPNTLSTVALRMKRETKRRVQAERAKANKKVFGKKIKCDELIVSALNLLAGEHISALQDQSLTNYDRLEKLYLDYQKHPSKSPRASFSAIEVGLYLLSNRKNYGQTHMG